MTYSELEGLLRSARALMDGYMFDGEELRDDVATLCMKIDDALPDPSPHQASFGDRSSRQ